MSDAWCPLYIRQFIVWLLTLVILIGLALNWLVDACFLPLLWLYIHRVVVLLQLLKVRICILIVTIGELETSLFYHLVFVLELLLIILFGCWRKSLATTRLSWRLTLVLYWVHIFFYFWLLHLCWFKCILVHEIRLSLMLSQLNRIEASLLSVKPCVKEVVYLPLLLEELFVIQEVCAREYSFEETSSLVLFICFD